tara:strand:- start:22329 stop:23471 length:1143 start_codon:yes stop_codon:yes gene_type:complete
MSRLIISLILFTFFQAEGQNPSALAIADSLYDLGNYSKATASYKDADPSEASLFKIAKSYEALGNYSEAIKYYKVLYSEYPNVVNAKYNYGKLLASIGETEKAISIFEQLLSESPHNPNFYFQLGLTQEKIDDSIAHLNFQKAYRLDSNHLNALYKIAKRNVEKRNFDDARPLVKIALTTQELSVRFLLLDALLNFHTDQYHEAIVSFEKLDSLNYSTVQFHESLAKSYVQTNRFEAAINQYTILINQFDDKNPSWHFHIAQSYMALHYFEKAERHINIAIGLQEIPLDGEYSALARIYNRKKEFKKEMKALEKALGENPRNELAQYQLAVAADNYYDDKNVVLDYYHIYLEKHGETGRMRELAKQRVRDIKKELHFTKN